ncbi:MAG TPA: ABC transporter ATP-binding protein [Acidimicrobiales bacterium]
MSRPADQRTRPLEGIGAAVGLAWRAAPGPTAAYAALTLLGSLIPVGVVWLTKLLFDALVTGGLETTTTVWLALGLAAAGLVGLALQQVTRAVSLVLERRVSLRSTDELYTAVGRFVGLVRFEDPEFRDRLRLAAESGGRVPSQVLDGLLGLVKGLITIVSFIGALLVLSPVITAAVVVSAVPTLLGELSLARRRAAMFWEVGPTERLELAYSMLLSSVEAAQEVRLFGLADFLRIRLLAQRRLANAARWRLERRELVLQSSFSLLSAGVAGAGILWAVAAAQRGELSVGDIALMLASVGALQGAMAQTVGDVANTHEGLLMFSHFRAVVHADPDLPLALVPRPVPVLREGVEFRDVWFRYSDEHPWALRGVNLHIPSGKAVALVGRNGAGKSTLVKLLCRLYDPSRGAILWDGIDLRELDPGVLRLRLGAVFQDYMHYEMTASENIGVGDLDALGDDARLRDAARRADVHRTLSALPQGYDTMLTRTFFGETDDGDPATGVALSGGQWQRVALARAFLRDDRDLLILDEPSSGLDVEAEHMVHTRLRQHRSCKTTLLISHRLSTVREADAIAVLDDGRIVELGDHEQLLAARGIYARLFTLQAQGYRSSPVGQLV